MNNKKEVIVSENWLKMPFIWIVDAIMALSTNQLLGIESVISLIWSHAQMGMSKIIYLES